MKGAWKVRGTTFRFSMSWYARMLQKSAMWTLLKRNHNLFRQFSFVFFWEQVSSNDAFFQVIPTFFYRKPRLDVTCVVLYIERSERPSFRRRVSLTVYKFRIPSTDLASFLLQADYHAKYNGQKSECMEESARIIAKAFGNCMTDRCSAFPYTVYFLILCRIYIIGHHHLINQENGEFIMLLV